MVRRIRLLTAAVGLVAGLVLLTVGDTGGRAIGLALLAAGGVLLLAGRGRRGTESDSVRAESATPQELWRSMDQGHDPTQG